MLYKNIILVLVLFIENLIYAHKVNNFYIGIQNFNQVNDNLRSKGKLYITASEKSKIEIRNDTFFIKFDSSQNFNSKVIVKLVCKKNNKIIFKETRKYIFKNIPKPYAILGNLNEQYLEANKRYIAKKEVFITKNEFLKQDSLWVYFGNKDFPNYNMFKIDTFNIMIATIKGNLTNIKIVGNKIPISIKEIINKTDIGTIVVFSNIKTYDKYLKDYRLLLPFMFKIY